MFISFTDQNPDHGIILPLQLYTAGDGNEYLYADISLEESQTFYFTLRQVASLVNTNHPEAASVNAFPNPFSEHVTIEGLEQADQINVYDIAGKLLLSQTATAPGLTLKLNSKPGVYLIRIIRDDTVIWSEKITKI